MEKRRVKNIQLSCPNGKYYVSETVSAALKQVRIMEGLESNSQLRTEAAEPFTRPFPGVHVWVWRADQEWDADTAYQLAVPAHTAEVWRRMSQQGTVRVTI